jgi:hypothetical protein
MRKRAKNSLMAVNIEVDFFGAKASGSCFTLGNFA